MDVYCGISPRPGPNSADHTWWMAAGEGSDMPNKAVKLPQHPITSDNKISEDYEEGRNSSGRSLGDAADDAAPPRDLIHAARSSGREEEGSGGGVRRNSGAAGAAGAGGPAPEKGEVHQLCLHSTGVCLMYAHKNAHGVNIPFCGHDA